MKKIGNSTMPKDIFYTKKQIMKMLLNVWGMRLQKTEIIIQNLIYCKLHALHHSSI